MIKTFCIAIISVVILQACSVNRAVNDDKNSVGDKSYNSELPEKIISDEIEFVTSTVRKLNIMAFYTTYDFAPGAIIDKSNLNESNLIIRASKTSMRTESVAGTAIIIYYDNLLAGMLTCNHVVDFPDTIITWYRSRVQGIKSIAIKEKQNNYVLGLPEGNDVVVVAKDKNNDIAFLKKQLKMTGAGINVLNYPVGNSKDIGWGSRVYIVGYPLGNLMVTDGMVSKPRNVIGDRFLLDATFNQGISGSPVLALKHSSPYFELVGMATSASAKSIEYLKPAESKEAIQSTENYTGSMVVDRERMINYGVTYSVTIDRIQKFLKSNYDLLKAEGFDPDKFFK